MESTPSNRDQTSLIGSQRAESIMDSVYWECIDLGVVIGDRGGFDTSLKDVQLCDIKVPHLYRPECSVGR